MKVKVRLAQMSALLLFILYLPRLSTAQDKCTVPYYSFGYRFGQNRPHRENIMHLNYFYQGAEFKLGWQTPGASQWQHAYRFPRIGLGINWNWFDNETLGKPAALYFFTGFPQFRSGRFRLDLELNLGAAYGFKPYDPIKNPSNKAIGSAGSVYFGIFAEQALRLTDHLELFIGQGLSHYSTGSLSYPNTGLNILMLKAGMNYQPQRAVFENRTIPKMQPSWSVSVNLFSGSKKLDAPTPNYEQYGLSLSLNRRLSYKNRVLLGYETAYNEATQMMYWDRTLRTNELISHALYAGHEFVIERFLIVGHLGLYLKNRPTDKGYYERLALAFEVLPKTYLSLQLKAHKVKAEYIELGLSHRIEIGKQTKTTSKN